MKTKDKILKEKKFNDNIGLVYSVAKAHYRHLMPLHGDDILQEGFAALLQVIDRFDESKGFKFSTYATSFIWGKMESYVQTKILQKKKTSIKSDNGYKTGYVEAHMCSIYAPIAGVEESMVIDTIGEFDSEYETLENELLVETMLEEIRELEERNALKKYKNVYKVVLLKYQGYTNYQIAKLLGVSHTLVQNKFNLARDYFRSGGGRKFAN